MARAKTKARCTVSRDEFLQAVQTEVVELLGTKLLIEPRTFSSGSFGLSGQAKIAMLVNGKPIRFQVTLNATVIGSAQANNGES